MVLTYKNINANYQFSQWEEFSGHNELTIDGSLMYKFMLHNDNVVEYGQDDCDYCLKEQGEDIDSMEKDELSDFTTSNADLQILIFNYILEEIEEDVTVSYAGKNLFWFYRNMQHAEYDVASGTIYVDASTEEKRILDALQYMVENNCYTFDENDMELIESFETDFYNRWKYRFNLEEAINITGLYNWYYGDEDEE